MKRFSTHRAFSILILGGLNPALVGASESLLDLEKGRKLYATCAACHDPGKPTKSGPDLRGIFGRKIATQPGFRYSRAMQKARIVWDDTTIEAFLASPQDAVPGNAMPFPGLLQAAERRDLLAFLKTLNP